MASRQRNITVGSFHDKHETLFARCKMYLAQLLCEHLAHTLFILKPSPESMIKATIKQKHVHVDETEMYIRQFLRVLLVQSNELDLVSVSVYDITSTPCDLSFYMRGIATSEVMVRKAKQYLGMVLLAELLSYIDPQYDPQKKASQIKVIHERAADVDIDVVDVILKLVVVYAKANHIVFPENTWLDSKTLIPHANPDIVVHARKLCAGHIASVEAEEKHRYKDTQRYDPIVSVMADLSSNSAPLRLSLEYIDSSKRVNAMFMRSLIQASVENVNTKGIEPPIFTKQHVFKNETFNRNPSIPLCCAGDRCKAVMNLPNSPGPLHIMTTMEEERRIDNGEILTFDCNRFCIECITTFNYEVEKAFSLECVGQDPIMYPRHYPEFTVIVDDRMSFTEEETYMAKSMAMRVLLKPLAHASRRMIPTREMSTDRPITTMVNGHYQPQHYQESISDSFFGHGAAGTSTLSH